MNVKMEMVEAMAEAVRKDQENHAAEVTCELATLIHDQLDALEQEWGKLLCWEQCQSSGCRIEDWINNTRALLPERGHRG